VAKHKIDESRGPKRSFFEKITQSQLLRPRPQPISRLGLNPPVPNCPAPEPLGPEGVCKPT
jgi:hypothetical protein